MKRTILTLGTIFATLLVQAADNPPDTFRVEKRDFVKTVTLSGELQAVSRTVIAVPRVSRMRNMVISYLAPEGSTAKVGDILVQFDVSELEARKLELEKQREDAQIKIAQTRADLESRRQDLLLTVATATKDLRVSELYVGIEPELIPASDAEKYQFDNSKARIELDKADQRLVTLQETEKAELQVVQLEFEQANLDLERIRSELGKLVIRAPTPGLVVYSDNPNRAGKIQVGDSVWSGWPVIYLPNMESLMVEAYAYDSDFPLLKEGMTAEIYLDAAPLRRFTGAVRSISESAQSREFRSQLKAFKIGVPLDQVDQELMKPGMTARVRIPVTLPDALVVPRAAVHFDPSLGAYVVRPNSAERIPVEVVEANGTSVAVKGDVLPGEELRPTIFRSAGDEASTEVEWIKIERDDFRFFVSGAGTIEASRQVSIGPPSIPDTWRFKIVNLVPEGTAVQAGDLLVSFDPTETQREIREEKAALEKVIEELEKTRASEELKLKDLEIQLEEARVQDEKARNKLIEAREFESNLKVKEAEYEAQFAKSRLELLEKKLSFVRESSLLQIKILEDHRLLHQYRIDRYVRALDELNVTAPNSGVVIYETNWRNEKKQIGSDVFRMEKILSLPDLDTLVIKGQISEVDAGRVQAGQEVTAILDALPDRPFAGRIEDVGTIFRRASFDRPIKVLDLVIELQEIDASIMRPGMAAKLEIVTHRFGSVLAVPLSAIRMEGSEAYVWVKNGEKVEHRKILLGEDNGLVAVVTEGLREGEEIASHPLGGVS